MKHLTRREKNKIRNSLAYKSWRKSVFERDRYICRRCKSIEHLEAHHIKPFNVFAEEGLDIDNGITLCYPCHKEATLILKERYWKNHKYRKDKDIIINEELEDNEYIRQLDKSIE